MKLRFILGLLLITTKIFSQELIQVTEETITVNSTSAINGYTRNITSVTLPEKTKGYIYRLSIVKKGQQSNSSPLLDLLENMEPANISLAASFSKFAIQNNDNEAVDAFIFNNTYDADNFYAKKDNNWSSCKSMFNRVSCCFASQDCIGHKIFFGFRNNNIMQGLDIKLEVVALVDNTMTNNFKYSYSINNTSNQELKFLISIDNINWTETTLRSGYLKTFTFEQNEIYFKINTNNFKSASYKMIPNERYKILWNQNLSKWDLNRY